MEQFGGAEIGDAGRKEEPPTGCPTPFNLYKLEGCFDNLFSTAVTGKDALDELVKSNADLTKTVATLTDTKSRHMKNVEALTNELKWKKNGVGCRVPELSNGKERQYCSNFKRPTWHGPDDCF